MAFGQTHRRVVHAGESTVSTQLFSGLGNQIYQIVNSCIIAAKTGRKLRFPFPLLSRKTASDPFRDVEFASLFDPDTFLKAASSFITTTTATGVFFFLYDERKQAEEQLHPIIWPRHSTARCSTRRCIVPL